MPNQEDPKHLLVSIARILDDLKIPYLITGGIAVLVWGRPRFTADIDVVIEVQKNNLSKNSESTLNACLMSPENLHSRVII